MSAHALDLRRDCTVGKLLARTSGHSALRATIRPSRHLRTTRTFFLVHTDSLHTSQDCLFHSSFCFEEKKWCHPYFLIARTCTTQTVRRTGTTSRTGTTCSTEVTPQAGLHSWTVYPQDAHFSACPHSVSVNSPRLCFLLEPCISEKVVLSNIIADCMDMRQSDGIHAPPRPQPGPIVPRRFQLQYSARRVWAIGRTILVRRL